MSSKRQVVRLLVSIPLIGLAALLCSVTWSISSSASENLVNAVEAGVPETVSQTTWLEITAGFISLTLANSALASVLALKVFSMFSRLERLLVFDLPIAAVALTPLAGAAMPLLPVIVIIVCVTLRSEKHARTRSLQQ